jgi:two-component system OmpR family response regulator
MEAFIIPLLLFRYVMTYNENTKKVNGNQVFIVEDDDMHSLMMDYMLSKDTVAHIKKFKSGEECVSNLDKNPDVVILDYGLPGINGMQTLLQIKKQAPEIPVIVVTGNKNKELERDFYSAGVYDYIPKDENAFEQVSRLTSSILNIIAAKEAKEEHRRHVLLSIGVMVAISLIGILTWVMMRH